ncbi:glycoside hydrolase family 32 protein [Arenibacter palladensis]|uniref:glycoside hydrolase family 32 protein n=1 Tax=Arenibacter palladensis TaxID=237373 RepID=UPI0026E16BDC|nr:glycoside hydrolase family 32 protein [Arenibacter palladensis]MDO6602855.1 glycoside hydrolase family 32 protein [Arenibacter palladensis]
MRQIRFITAVVFFNTSLMSVAQISNKGDSEFNMQLREVTQNPQVIAFRKNREAIANFSHRPLYHFSAPLGRIHDPNGLCYWNGQYHLFYQYFDTDPETDGIRWGHTYSSDLVHWKDLPVAIKPTVEKSSFSGQTLVEKDRVIAMWHGTNAGSMIAIAKDPLLLNWEMNPNNPVIPENDKEGPYQVFDPCIWKQDDGFYYALSGSYKNGRVGKDCIGEVHAFKSKDLSEWKWLGAMFTDSILSEPGEDMVVPNFWPIGNGKHMLLCFSHKRAGRGYVGTYNPETVNFVPDYHFRANHGAKADRKGGLRSINSSVHAPSATIDDKGRYIAFFNMVDYKEKEGWSGIMTLPRTYSLAKDNSIRIRPVKELEKLRFNQQKIENLVIKTDSEIKLKDIKGKAMEINAVIYPGKAKELGLKVLQSANGLEYTLIHFSNNKITIENKHPLRDERLKLVPESASLTLQENEPLKLQIFIDRSVVEVFANERVSCSLRVYPEDNTAREVSIFSKGGSAKMVSLKSWQMRSVWPELKFKEGK